ncbi:hypothetical protein JVT61DRAFT_10707 [Boletus reticuloceps]|uniref:Uncharacterized protein n=1 Tax=Boletus reticuloceps TaxID=495285 RepID=A0A8I2YFP2_9AGAM|nr:hypothetical protein JVT61DRAFT_10707 [Boletus reticuloceps]
MAHHTTNPSPLRYYNAFDSAIQGPSSSGEVRTSSSNVERAPLYRRASYKSSEHHSFFGASLISCVKSTATPSMVRTAIQVLRFVTIVDATGRERRSR